MEPLTIKNFYVSDLFIPDPYAGRYGLTLAKFISLQTNKSLPNIRIDGDLNVLSTRTVKINPSR